MFKMIPILGQRINIPEIRMSLLNELRKQGREVRKLYKKTTRTWKRQPKFDIKVRLERGYGASAMVHIYTTDEIYHYVDLGTRAHAILPKPGKRLHFKTGGRPKTKARRITSYAGKRGTKHVTAKAVRHPGTKAREFTKEIYKRRKGPFQTAMKKAMRYGLKKATANWKKHI